LCSSRTSKKQACKNTPLRLIPSIFLLLPFSSSPAAILDLVDLLRSFFFTFSSLLFSSLPLQFSLFPFLDFFAAARYLIRLDTPKDLYLKTHGTILFYCWRAVLTALRFLKPLIRVMTYLPTHIVPLISSRRCRHY